MNMISAASPVATDVGTSLAFLELRAFGQVGQECGGPSRSDLKVVNDADVCSGFANLYRETTQIVRRRTFPALRDFDRDAAFVFFLRSIVGARTLGEMIEWAVDWGRTFLPDFYRLELMRGNGRAHVQTTTLADSPADVMLDEVFSISLLISAMKWAVGGRLAGLKVSFAHQSAISHALFQSIFPYHSFVEPGKTEFSLPTEELLRPVWRQPAEVDDFIRSKLQIAVAGIGSERATASGVETLLDRTLLTNGRLLTLNAASAALDITPATLKRRLESENTTFGAIRAAVVDRRAKTWLRETDMSLAQIAEALDFSDGNSFRRFFLRVNGLSASTFRCMPEQGSVGCGAVRRTAMSS